jgi:hypothetical protein
MARTVLLSHDLLDGSSHFDWMIQGPGGSDSPLITFRVAVRIDRGDVVDFLAQRLADHRAAYLEYEGEVSGGRGRVRRVAQGDLDLLNLGVDDLVARGRLGEAAGVFRGRADAAGVWAFQFQAGGAG